MIFTWARLTGVTIEKKCFFQWMFLMRTKYERTQWDSQVLTLNCKSLCPLYSIC